MTGRQVCLQATSGQATQGPDQPQLPHMLAVGARFGNTHLRVGMIPRKAKEAGTTTRKNWKAAQQAQHSTAGIAGG